MSFAQALDAFLPTAAETARSVLLADPTADPPADLDHAIDLFGRKIHRDCQLLAMRVSPEATAQIGDLELDEIHLDTGIARFDLFAEAFEREGRIVTRLECSRRLFSPEAIARLAADWTDLLEELVAHPDRPLSRLR